VIGQGVGVGVCGGCGCVGVVCVCVCVCGCGVGVSLRVWGYGHINHLKYIPVGWCTSFTYPTESGTVTVICQSLMSSRD
jgi:hypothetical protein